MEEIFKRRSVRSYTDKDISQEDLNLLLKAAMHAPSAGNQQPWEFIVVKNRDIMKAITEFHPYSSMLNSAACAVIICANKDYMRLPEFWVQDCSAATQNLLLEAVHLGIGAVWLGVYPREEPVTGIQKLFELPEQVIPLCVVSLGYPETMPEAKDIWLEERVHMERW